MATQVSPPMTIHEEDIQAYDIPNSVADSIPVSINMTQLSLDHAPTKNEYPFEFLFGETLVESGQDLKDGDIYLTTYRLFTFSNQSTLLCSFINCPIRLVDLIEIKDNNHLLIQCKELRTFRLIFSTSDRCNYWYKIINESISILSFDDMFALKYFQPKLNDKTDNKHDYFINEIKRLKLDQTPWRITSTNDDYKICSSYPNKCVVPACISDEEILEVAKFRSNRRFPTIVWRHSNGAVIARSSQPEVGWLFWRSKEDEKMVQAIMSSCQISNKNDSTNQNVNTKRLLIYDARSYKAALANRAKGGGFEHAPYYNDCDVEFMNLPNIHVIRKSAQVLRNIIANDGQGETWLTQLESSKWLHNLFLLINAALSVASTVDTHARPVLIHCSDGWDRTPQIITLAEIILDPYYRTIEGFQILIQHQWIDFGHKFADRCGHGNGSSDTNERSPVFLQWLDCVYQLFIKNPTAFEFNEMFLLKLAHHTYSCLFGTFLCNTTSDRVTLNCETRTHSVWSLLNADSKQFINHLYEKSKREIFNTPSSIHELVFWQKLYLYDIRHSPAGSIEHSKKQIPTRARSYEDLASSSTNNLHRATSYPSLTTSFHADSSSTTVSPTNNSPINQQQSQTNHLEESQSTSSLFGPPHQLGTLNDSNLSVANHANSNNLSSPLRNNSDNRLTQQNSKTDDLSSDISHFVRLIQHSSPNTCSNDSSIQRNIAYVYQHTNSISSIDSSLSEASSLTKINTNDPSQTVRTLQNKTTHKIIKLVKKRIDVDGLTKLPDPVTSRMIQIERNYQKEKENLQKEIRKLEKVIYTIISLRKTNLHAASQMDSSSQSSLSIVDSPACSSWQKVDNIQPSVTLWMPDFYASGCTLCQSKFYKWSLSRKHHCRQCGNIFCGNCSNFYKIIPSLSLTEQQRVCRDCLPKSENNSNCNNNSSIETARHPSSMPIQNGCRHPNGTSNGSFNSPTGQKVKG